MARPVTNHDLHDLLAEAAYTHGAFARQINHAVGAGRYDAASVYWWLRGRRPDPATRTAVAAVLARRLHRTIATDRLGFDQDLSIGLSYPTTPGVAVTTATGLWKLGVDHAAALAATPYASDAAVQTALAWRYDPDDPHWSRPGPRIVTTIDVEALTLYAGHFADLDRRGGGAATRILIADFLHRQVGPMLHASYTDTVGRALMSAAAELAGQLAYMAYDAGENGAALRHYTIALRLSRAAADRLYGAHLLANLATQAVHLGHRRTAVRLALAAIDGAGRAPAAVLARLHTTAACAHAVAEDRRSCTRSLRAAQAAIARSRPGAAPAWAGYFGPAHFAGTAARCFRDLNLQQRALTHGPAALTLPADSTRTRALHTALLATIYAEHGDLDAACSYGDQAVTHTRTVQSRRVRQRLTELTTRLHPHRREPVVCRLLRPPPRPAHRRMTSHSVGRSTTVTSVSTWIEPEMWYAQLPSFYATTAALITESATDRVLLVKPTYREHWAFPGGYLEADEYPQEGCARELREELGLDPQPNTLLVVDWAPPAGPRPKAIISMTFDAGQLPHDAVLQLPADELSTYAFFDPQLAAAHLPGDVAPRVAAALEARRTGKAIYLCGRP